MKRNPLKRNRKINKTSLKKIRELQGETEIRIRLCQRAKGMPVLGKHTYYYKGKSYPVTTVQCYDGICECGCEEHSSYLEPHEKVFRSQGGKLSEENSIMVKREHHRKLQNNELHWTK